MRDEIYVQAVFELVWYLSDEGQRREGRQEKGCSLYVRWPRWLAVLQGFCVAEKGQPASSFPTGRISCSNVGKL